MARLSNDRISAELEALPQWSHDGKATLNSIKKVFKFKDFSEAWAFMNRVAELCNKADHHPEWSNVYNRVEIALTTHSDGGVSEKDIKLAADIEAVVATN